ncbi:MAG TPA: TonB-dependent receptor [Bacteroidales bacterium]|nr:TonB-dependent receptor [Bacteroidales bacterium]HPJ59456.1 TonB-dependent receptor [Bacteroidales bacterium]HPR12657.1 TonB-dependent receptor [Bacteroidales bacterium]
MFIFFWNLPANAVSAELFQQLQVTGTVVDVNGLPLTGVNVVVKGTTIGVTTDINGRYTLTVPNRNAVIAASFIGYVTQEMAVGDRNVVDFTLSSEELALDEVVVVGYGTQKKVNVIGSVTTVSTDELTASPTNTLSQSLGGRLPGLIVQQTTGEPGRDDADLLIRGQNTLGNNSVLIVVDGIPERDMNSIEPGDIESLTVLKDASAGIYGSRAANGVILITTKKGSEGAARFEYDFYHGWGQPTVLPKMTDAATYAQMINEVKTYRNEALTYTPEDIEKYKSGEYPWTHPNTDWFQETFRKWTNSNHHTFRITGGSKTFRYFASFGTQSDNGTYKLSATSYKRFNLKTNLDAQLNQYISLNFDINASEEDMTFPTRSTSNIFNGLIRNFPNSPALWPNGLYGPDIEYGDQPLATSSFDGGFDDDKHYRINPMLTATIKIPWVEGLTLAGNYAYDMYFRVRKFFEKPITLYFFDEAGYLAAGNTGKEDGSDFLTGIPRARFAEPRLTDYYYDTRRITNSLKLSYEKTFGVHSVSAFVAVESTDYMTKGIQGYRRYFISDQLPYLNAGGTDEMSNASSIGIDARLNYFGRATYNYAEKYLFEFTLRRDGSLRFSKDAGRWGTFPSVLLGWRMSSENFWNSTFPFINYFKLKGSWGQMGNDAVDAFQYLTLYGYSTGFITGSSKTYVASLVQSSVPNPNITWEVANIFNGGFESQWIDGKITWDVDVFYQRRSNILWKKDASVPGFTGLSLPDENFGIVDSRGFETILGYRDQTGSFSYSVNGNFAFQRNKIVDYDEPARAVEWQQYTGHPIGAVLQYNSIGVFDDADDMPGYPRVSDPYAANSGGGGGIIIEDYDKNGSINANDRIIYDFTTVPEITYGISIALGWKNFSLTTLFQGVGNTWYRADFPIMGTWGNYWQYYADDRWTPENKTASKPRAFERVEDYWRGDYLTDFDYYNHAFLRWKNLEIGYNIPKDILSKVKLQSLKIYLSGQNLALLYNAFDYKHDPEVSNVASYPLHRVIAMGAKVAF